MRLKALAAAVGTKRPWDLRRRRIARLAEAGVVHYDEPADAVRLRDGWLEALDRERTMSGEKRTENLDRAEYDRQREARLLFLGGTEDSETGAVARIAPPAPPTDRRFWRLLLARAHPDHGGSEDLFVWCQNLREHVAGDCIEPTSATPHERHRDPPPHPQAGERIELHRSVR